jgi:hypothetical protein
MTSGGESPLRNETKREKGRKGGQGHPGPWTQKKKKKKKQGFAWKNNKLFFHGCLFSFGDLCLP